MTASMKGLHIQTLRRVAWIGLAVVLLVDLVLSARARSGVGLGVVMLFLFPVAVALVSLVLMPAAAGTLVRHRDLLVPLALVTVAGNLIEWLSAAPLLGALLNPSLPLHLLNLSFALSLGFLLQIALGVAYATWMTGTLLEFARTGMGDPSGVLSTIPQRFWRVLGLEFIGWAMVMVVTAFMLLLMPVLGFFALVPMAVFGVGWNFSTAAVLPVALEGQRGFWRSFRAGVAASLGNLGQWWLLLLAQMLLLGLVFFYYRHQGGNTNMSWSVNVFWTGGYEADCRWYAKLAEAAHSPKLPLVGTLLALLFGAFAVAIKLAIIQRLLPKPPPDVPPVIPSDRPEGPEGTAA
jgi:hypothetical protein